MVARPLVLEGRHQLAVVKAAATVGPCLRSTPQIDCGCALAINAHAGDGQQPQQQPGCYRRSRTDSCATQIAGTVHLIAAQRHTAAQRRRNASCEIASSAAAGQIYLLLLLLLLAGVYRMCALLALHVCPRRRGSEVWAGYHHGIPIVL